MKSPKLPQSPRKTFLPNRGESKLSGRAQEPVAKPAPPPPRLRHGRTFQTRTRLDRPVVLHRKNRTHRHRLDQSVFPAPCAGTTSVADSPLRARRCDKSRSSGWILRENVSFRGRPSEIPLA